MGGNVTTFARYRVTLADRIAAARAAFFVGRQAEQARLRGFLASGASEVLWFLVGPGGGGKSALLRRMAALAADLGWAPVLVDACQISPNPPAARHAVARAAGSDSLETFCKAHERPLLLIDSFEYWQVLEPWLREEFLPDLPGNLKVVLAGRTEPSLEWRTDEGWRPLMCVDALADLGETDCCDYLRRRGVEAGDRPELIRFAGGHPLALAMGADAVLAGKPVQAEPGDADDAVIGSLVESFTREAQDADQRRAMDACAIVRELNESLLARMLGTDDPGELYAWLRRLSFIEGTGSGIAPHDLVREVLMREMPRRQPGRYEAMARAAVDWTVDRIEAAETLSWSQSARLAADGMYTLRALPVVQFFMQPTGTHSLYLDGARPADYPALSDMVARHEGESSRDWFEFWRQRYPDNVYVVRDARESPRGFFLKLDMETLDPADRDADPLTARLWAALDGRLRLRPGEHAPFVRFWVTASYTQSQCPEKTQILMAISTYNMTARNLRLTAQVFGDSDDWLAQARALGIDALADSEVTVGNRTWRIYYNDWQRESPTRYYRLFADRCIGFDSAVAGEATPAQPYKALTEDEFRDAVIQALRQFHRPAGFADTPLLASALVIDKAGRSADEQTRMRVLSEAIRAAADTLSRGGVREQRWQRVLHRAYFAPARGQKEAAASLNMAYSTFRRQLAEARRALADELWQRERGAR